jgi:hypothetical protein
MLRPPLAVAAALAVTAGLVAAQPVSAADLGRRCSDGDTPPAGLSSVRRDRAVLCLLNAERARRALIPLRGNSRLRTAAVSHAREMVFRGYFAHTSTRGGTLLGRVERTGYLNGARDWVIGEDLAWGAGWRARPTVVMQEWMHSPAHRRQILNPRFREAGIAVELGVPLRSRDAAEGATFAVDFGGRVG